jgi:hypothetical protein
MSAQVSRFPLEPQSQTRLRAKILVAAEALDDAFKPKAKRKSFSTGDAAFERAKSQVMEMVHEGDFVRCKARHMVALYAVLHEKVYGIAPLELTPKTRALAQTFVTRLMKREFSQGESLDFAAMFSFMRWAWKREESREKWRRDHGRTGFRISWTYMFNGSLVTDYRLDRARVAK